MRLFLLTLLFIISVKGENLQKATLGGGCFWCIEAVFNQTKGISKAISGYSGGTTKNPTYKDVCNGVGEHAEVVQLSYDSDIISYEKILEIFFKVHNPTTLNRQGNDVGVQYRSVIFYHDENQLKIAKEFIAKEQKKYEDDIVTEIEPFKEFFKAEDYHQEYFKNNPNQSYCGYVVKPKVDKFKSSFKEWIKE